MNVTPGEKAARPDVRRFKHVILTRFNVRFVEDPNAPSIAVEPGWLTDRFRLFERYCLPSVLSQSEKNFSWLLFFDPATPEPFAERARALNVQWPNFHPVFTDRVSIPNLQETIRDLLPDRPEWLLTTRLDNDDGLHREFVARVQAAQRFEEAEVLNCAEGIILTGNRAYDWRHPSNAFISLSEPFEQFQTVLSIPRHVYASENYPVRQVGGGPLWLQVVHGRNVSNRIRGRRVRLLWGIAGFPALAELAPAAAAEHPISIVFENCTLYLIRSLRDLAATAARIVAKAVGVELRRKVASVRSAN